MRNAGLDEAQAGIKVAGGNINNLRYANDTILMAECEEELKSLLMKVKEESENAALKLNIQKAKIMASGPINSWQIDGETMETVTDFILGGSKITADGDCSHGIKRCLLLGKKSYDQPLPHFDILPFHGLFTCSYLLTLFHPSPLPFLSTWGVCPTQWSNPGAQDRAQHTGGSGEGFAEQIDGWEPVAGRRPSSLLGECQAGGGARTAAELWSCVWGHRAGSSCTPPPPSPGTAAGSAACCAGPAVIPGCGWSVAVGERSEVSIGRMLRRGRPAPSPAS